MNSSQLSFYASRFHLTNPHIETEGSTIAEQTLRLTLNRIVSEGIHEDIEIANYTGKKIAFLLEVAIRSDFADLFEVKSKHIVQRGKQNSVWNMQEKSLRTTYDNKDFHRAFTYRIPSDAVAFVVTKEYRLFAEFCDACRSSRYIGLGYGPPWRWENRVR